MFLRSAPSDTLATLMDNLDERTEALSVNASDIRVRHEDDVIVVGTREVPCNEEGMIALGNWLDVPTPFLKRIDNDLKEHLLNTLLHRAPHPVVAKVGEGGLRQLKEPNNKDIEPRRVVEIASHVIGWESPVVEWDRNLEMFRFDVVVRDNAEFGIGGDRSVNDLTKGGLRFGQDIRRNLAPFVQPFTYRLVCTNGMEIRDDGLKVDARGGSVDEVLAELEAAAQRAFARVESDITHFYEMRNSRVANPERHLARLAGERGLSDRATMRLINRLPSVVDGDSGTTTMFDLTNLITNAANDPAVTRWGARREFQSFGGHLVSSVVDRCNVCSSRL